MQATLQGFFMIFVFLEKPSKDFFFLFFVFFFDWKVLFLVVYKFSKFKHRSEISAECLPQNIFGLFSDF